MNDDPLKQNNASTPANTPEETPDTPSITPDLGVAPTTGDNQSPSGSALSNAASPPLSSPEPVLPVQPTINPQPIAQQQPVAESLSTHTDEHAALAPRKRSKWSITMIIVVVGLVVAAGLAYAAYRVGNSRGYKNGKAAQTTMTQASLKVPDHATMVAQCTAGEGTQYVLPSNIPQGPIYNVWNNKVTGVEYMLSQSEITHSKALNLSLMSQKYNHIDVMYEEAGHAGFTEPHYHIILSLVPYAQEQKITCSGSSSSMSSMDM